MSSSGSNSSSSFNIQNRPYVSKNNSKSSSKSSPNGFSLPSSSNNLSVNNLENFDKNNNLNLKLPGRTNKNNKSKKSNMNGRGYLNSRPISRRVPAVLNNNKPRYYPPSPIFTYVSVTQNDTLKALQRLVTGFPGILSSTSTPRVMWTAQRR